MGNLNCHCKWRLELAKKICEKIRSLEGTKGIRAIILGGSVARGYVVKEVILCNLMVYIDS